METEFLKFLGLRTYIATDNNLATKIHIFYEEILLRGGGHLDLPFKKRATFLVFPFIKHFPF